MKSKNMPTISSARLYPKLSEDRKAAFLLDLRQGILDGAVKPSNQFAVAPLPEPSQSNPSPSPTSPNKPATPNVYTS